MTLQSLLASYGKYEAHGALDVEITGLSYDSRRVQAGHLFAALPGHHTHGIRFLDQAVRGGAVAVLTDGRTPPPFEGGGREGVPLSLPIIYVDNPRQALARIGHHFYGNPSTKLKLYGITGTNGKTTASFLMRSVLEAAGLNCGLLGTVQYSGSAFRFPSTLTTPESIDLQEMLDRMLKEGCNACVMEVSSHSLVQHRVTGCTFESAVFTNLTQDHLDFHVTMEDYYQAKWMLFSEESVQAKAAVINADDSYGRRILADRRKKNAACVSYGFSADADCCVTEWMSSRDGSRITIRYGGNVHTSGTPLIGRYNAYNICSVFAAAVVSRVPVEAVLEGIARMKQVPGRMERIDHGQPYLILIDYAHTEDAMRQLMQTVRPYAERRLIVLFGCGGERDRGKRPLMGRAAGELADVVILTSDNPRREDPEQILQDVRTGVQQSGNSAVYEVPDRKEAIAFALRQAGPGDVLILAGKGHENYQIIGEEKIHFDEREILAELLGRF